MENKGVYAAFNLDDYSTTKLNTFILLNNIPNISKRFHVTLQYARECEGNPDDVVENMQADFAKAPPKMNVATTRLDVFDTQDGKRALVLKLNSVILSMVHVVLRRKYGLSYDYDDYKPHVTLSYDIGDMKLSDINTAHLPNFIVLVEPYAEELILDWQNK